MDSLLADDSGETIFPHQISCAMLIFHCCKKDDEDKMTAIAKEFKSEMILIALGLIQNVQLEYSVLLQKLYKVDGQEIIDAFRARMENLVNGKYVEMLDFFESLEPLTVSGNHYLHKSSIFGIFIRKLFLNYQKMSFTQIGHLGRALELYLKLDGSETKLEGLTLVQVALKEEENLKSGNVWLHQITTLSQVGKFIAEQIRLLEAHSPLTLSPKRLQEKISEILQRFPTAVEAYYLSFLNHLHVGEVRMALFDLHRYFDYQNWEEEQTQINETDKSAIERYQIKFKRFRYCALNLGMYHCCLGHKDAASAALQEAVKMAQVTNDNDCLVHCLFWLHQLKSESNSSKAQPLLEQFNKRAKELGYSQLQSLGTLMQCKFDAFSGNATYEEIQLELSKIDSMTATKSDVPAQKIQAGTAAFLDFFGYRTVSFQASQIALYGLQGIFLLHNKLWSFEKQDLESSVLALCQTARFLADEGLLSDAQNILHFGSSLVPAHSNIQKWILSCKWQLMFERCVFQRDIDGAKKAIEQIRSVEKEDANLRECQLLFLTENYLEAETKINAVLKDVEKNTTITIGNTPSALYHVRLLQLKAELFASSDELPKAINYLLECMHLCREYKMKNIETEINICLAQCKILLGLPQQSRSILNPQMIQILSQGTLYSRSLAFLVMAKSTLFCIEGGIDNSKAELLSLLPSLERCSRGFQALGASAALCESLYVMAQIYNTLGYSTERNKCAREVRETLESAVCSHPLTLYI